MLIVIEGADGTGKSTLAQRIADLKPGTVIKHFGPPTRHPLREYEEALLAYDPTEDDIVFDRLHWGEWIYGPLKRGESKLTMGMLRHIDMLIQAKGGVTVWLDVPDAEATRRVFGQERVVGATSTGQVATTLPTFLDHGELRWVLAAYRRFVYNDEPIYDPAYHANMLVRYATVREVASVPVDSYVGPRKPDIVFVGDTRGRYTEVGLPAFAPWKNSSGHFLFQALELTSILRDHRVGMLNARDLGDLGLQAALTLVGADRDTSIVALGQIADDRLTAARIDHGFTVHPAYASRFHHGELNTYAAMLFRATKGERHPW